MRLFMAFLSGTSVAMAFNVLFRPPVLGGSLVMFWLALAAVLWRLGENDLH